VVDPAGPYGGTVVVDPAGPYGAGGGTTEEILAVEFELVREEDAAMVERFWVEEGADNEDVTGGG